MKFAFDTSYLTIGAHVEAENLLQNDAFTPAREIRNEDDPFRDVTARDDAIVW